MRHSSLQRGALKAGATFYDTDPENFVFLGLDRKIAHELAPIREVLRGHQVGRPILRCDRCGADIGSLRTFDVLGGFVTSFPLYGCMVCGDRVDWMIQINRFLTSLGCQCPLDYSEGYRRLKLALLEREWTKKSQYRDEVLA